MPCHVAVLYANKESGVSGKAISHSVKVVEEAVIHPDYFLLNVLRVNLSVEESHVDQRQAIHQKEPQVKEHGERSTFPWIGLENVEDKVVQEGQANLLKAP